MYDGRCEVIEIKPNNKKAEAKGNKQLADYKSAIENLSDEDINEDYAVLKRCFKDGRPNIEYELKTYDFCPVPAEDIDAMVAKQVKQSQSTADE